MEQKASDQAQIAIFQAPASFAGQMNMAVRILLLICFLIYLPLEASTQPYRNLVLEGGGIRGIAYAGAIEVLEENRLTDSIEQVAGTSVGALAGCLIALGYDAGEMKSILMELRLQTFNDGRWLFPGGINRFNKQYGWYRGASLETWIGKFIARKTGSEHTSFAQLHKLRQADIRYKELYITATNLSSQKLTVFSYETYPDMEIKTAVRASVSIPLYYGAVFLDKAGRRMDQPLDGVAYDVFVDGGIIANYPLGLFDSIGPNKATLGLKLERRAQIEQGDSRNIAPYPIRHLGDYVGALYNITMETLNRGCSFDAEKGRTIYISTSDINPRVRRISKAQKEKLMDNGREGAVRFLERSQQAR
ncbi:MAG: patatin [Sphingobacteriales bacterium]|nr:MAG: patatin [Sphingobacteriales bacterium]